MGDGPDMRDAAGCMGQGQNQKSADVLGLQMAVFKDVPDLPESSSKVLQFRLARSQYDRSFHTSQINDCLTLVICKI